MENQLSERKYKAYSELVSLFYGILIDVKSQKNTNQKFTMTKMIEAKRDILMYGSDKVFSKFNQWLCATSEEKDSNKQMEYFLQLMLEIRKDMQGEKTVVKLRDILINLIQSRKEVEEFIRENSLSI